MGKPNPKLACDKSAYSGYLPTSKTCRFKPNENNPWGGSFPAEQIKPKKSIRDLLTSTRRRLPGDKPNPKLTCDKSAYSGYLPTSKTCRFKPNENNPWGGSLPAEQIKPKKSIRDLF